MALDKTQLKRPVNIIRYCELVLAFVLCFVAGLFGGNSIFQYASTGSGYFFVEAFKYLTALSAIVCVVVAVLLLMLFFGGSALPVRPLEALIWSALAALAYLVGLIFMAVETSKVGNQLILALLLPQLHDRGVAASAFAGVLFLLFAAETFLNFKAFKASRAN